MTTVDDAKQDAQAAVAAAIDEVTAEVAEKALARERDARGRACATEIKAALERHQCVLGARAYVDDQGRIQAEPLIAPRPRGSQAGGA